MSKFINENVTVIIRSVGERTEQLCYKLVSQQISEKNIFIIRGIPFSSALRMAFQKGIEEDRKWTFMIDADVLIKQNVLEDLIEFAETRDGHLFELHGDVICKFFGGNRDAGNHLYKTELLSKAFTYIAGSEKNIRPETYIIRNMSHLGYQQIKIKLITGLHDFEQYYRDIFRKSIVQAKKHNDRVKILFPYWKKMSKTDNDFKVAIEGFNYGEKKVSSVTIDASIDYNYTDILKEKNIIEKDDIIQQMNLLDVASFCASYRSPKEYYCIFHEIIKKTIK